MEVDEGEWTRKGNSSAIRDRPTTIGDSLESLNRSKSSNTTSRIPMKSSTKIPVKSPVKSTSKLPSRLPTKLPTKAKITTNTDKASGRTSPAVVSPKKSTSNHNTIPQSTVTGTGSSVGVNNLRGSNAGKIAGAVVQDQSSHTDTAAASRGILWSKQQQISNQQQDNVVSNHNPASPSDNRAKTQKTDKQQNIQQQQQSYHEQQQQQHVVDCNDNTAVMSEGDTTQQLTSTTSTDTASVRSIGQYSVNSTDLTCDLTSHLPCDPEGKSLNPSTTSSCSAGDDTCTNEFYYDDEFTVAFDARIGGENALMHVANGSSLSDNEDMDEFFMQCLSTSKSDSCLYQLEVNTSCAGSDVMFRSENPPLIEEEMISSADFRQVCRDKPLFSPVAGITNTQGVASASGHMGHASVDSLTTAECMNCSNLGASTEQFTYDWTANKDKYTLLFDKTTKASDDECSSCGQDSIRGSMNDSMTNWTQHSTVSAPIKMQTPRNSEESDGVVVRPTTKRQHSMTSWGEVRKQPSPDLVSWKNMKDSQTQSEGEEHGAVVCRNSRGGSSDRMTSTSDSVEEDNKRHSGTLLQIYQRLKSPDAAEVIANMEASDELEVSPEALKKMTGTWSISPCSERSSQMWESKSSVSGVPLASWNTMKNLRGSLGQRNSCAADSVSGESVDLNTTTESDGWGDIRTRFMNMRSRSRDACVQTSTCDDSVIKDKVNKSLQTSLYEAYKMRARPRARSLDESVEEKNTAAPAKQTFTPSSALPDLSFLKRYSSPVRTTCDGTISTTKSTGTDAPKASPRIMSGTAAQSKQPAKKLGGVRAGLPSLPSVDRLRQANSAIMTSVGSSSSSGVETGLSESPASGETAVSSSQRGRQMSPYRSIKKATTEDSLFSEYRRRNVEIPKDVPPLCECCQVRAAVPIMSQSQPAVLIPTDLSNSQNTAHTHTHTVHDGMKVSSSKQQTPGDMSRHILSKPLKSCLVKKAKDPRSLVKHRSFSDPKDLLILKAKMDKEQQKRYQYLMAKRHAAEASSASNNAHSTDNGSSSHAADNISNGSATRSVDCGNNIGNGQADSDGITESSRTLHHVSGDVTETSQLHQGGVVMRSPGTVARNRRRPDTWHGGIAALPLAAQVAKLSGSGDYTGTTSNGADGLLKKCVSFSENICYHSPANTPQDSPSKSATTVNALAGGNRIPRTTTSKPVPKPNNHNSASSGNHASVSRDIDDVLAAPPRDFVVPLTAAEKARIYINTDITTTTVCDGTVPKQEFLIRVQKASKLILDYVDDAAHNDKKIHLCSTATNPEFGHLLLRQFCPAVFAMLSDGLKTHVRSMFGRIRNSVWNVVESSAVPGPVSQLFYDILVDLRNLDFLSTSWLKFNAFIFALLNRHAFDYWLRYLYSHSPLLDKHYEQDSYMVLSITSHAAMSAQLMSALHPLNELPLRLEYNFEFSVLQQEQQKQIVTYMLDKHTSQPVVSGDLHHNIAGQNSTDVHHSSFAQPQTAVYTQGAMFDPRLISNAGIVHPGATFGSCSSAGLGGYSMMHPHPALVNPTGHPVMLHGPIYAWGPMHGPHTSALPPGANMPPCNLPPMLAGDPTTAITVPPQTQQQNVALPSAVSRSISLHGADTSPAASTTQRIKQGSRRLITKLWTSVDQGGSASAPGTAINQPIRATQPYHVTSASTNHSVDANNSEGSHRELTAEEDNIKNESILSKVVKQLRSSTEDLMIRSFGETSNKDANKASAAAVSDSADNATDNVASSGNDTATSNGNATSSSSSNSARVAQSDSGVDLHSRTAHVGNGGVSGGGSDVGARSRTVDGMMLEGRGEGGTLDGAAATGHIMDQHHQQKRWSDTDIVHTQQLAEAVQSGPPVNKKRWSTFGPNLINVFDKLLLGNKSAATDATNAAVSKPCAAAATNAANAAVSKPCAAAATTNTADTNSEDATDAYCIKSSQAIGSVQASNKLQPMRALPVPGSNQPATGSQDDPRCGGNSQEQQLNTPRRAHSLEEPPTDSDSGPNYVQALCHYLASDDAQLSLQKGDVLRVVEQVDAEWLMCNYGNKQGKVHRDHIKQHVPLQPHSNSDASAVQHSNTTQQGSNSNVQQDSNAAATCGSGSRDASEE